MSNLSFVHYSTLRHVSRALQDVTSELPYELSTKVVSRPSWFFSGARSFFQCRHASTSSEKSKSSVLRSRSGTPPSAPAAAIAKRLGPTSAATSYIAFGATKKLFEACAAQADYTVPQAFQKGAEIPKTAAGEDLGVGEGWWYKEIGLLPTFSSWSQVTFLHMYLLTVRIRNFPQHEVVQEFSRSLVDHFSHEAENRMDIMHGITQRPIRVKYLKDLFLQWRGILVAYDEGLIKGDAVLGAAVWRNLFKGAATGPDGKEINWAHIARVVAYMRRVINQLAAVDDAALVSVVSGSKEVGANKGIFALNPLDEQLANRKSKGLDEPFQDKATMTDQH
ncbi:hypothetical protein VTO42DRAFT_5131 [Malbranchea cinnamomea]